VREDHDERITQKKWESCRGLGFSFGYNQVEGPGQGIAADKLIALLVDIVSKNGNLLLNVGPRPDGSIPEIQANRLNKLGAWLAVNGEGIFDSSLGQSGVARLQIAPMSGSRAKAGASMRSFWKSRMAFNSRSPACSALRGCGQLDSEMRRRFSGGRAVVTLQ
jgi:alpha-L-fucosidase